MLPSDDSAVLSGSTIASSTTMGCGHVPIGKQQLPDQVPHVLQCVTNGVLRSGLQTTENCSYRPPPHPSAPFSLGPITALPLGSPSAVLASPRPLSCVAWWRVTEKGHFSALQLAPSEVIDLSQLC